MFDNRIVFETPGNLPGLVRPENIRHTHFSRNPKIALFLKAYKFVKEFGEGVDRICTELEQTGTPLLVFHPNYFILQTTLYEETIPNSTEKSSEKEESSGKKFGEKVRGKSSGKRIGTTARKIIDLMRVNPEISIPEIAIEVQTSVRNVEKHTSNLQKKGFIRRIDGDKGGHWEVIE